ncbi:MAG: NAD(P)H-binding protein [Caldilineaceae bacterium SB0664_bin_27]|uniref:NAD(P)H-binding protein n=1 Tax=Caldilineaceae bacterium SB0664_bin_27 TaxID=2605260 RepID=A0A6B0YMR3_9CHLR|nr:NAD(P)H-binding protein [Caldilineaceae bacterium SB0664_bin_27]
MILVTGAAGKTGRAVLDALAAAVRPQPARAWLRRPEQAEGLPAAETVVGDLADPRLWEEACRGIEAVYLICPNMYPRELEVGQLAVQAARLAGVRLIVYHSVLHPQTEEMPHHWQKLRVEEEIFRGGLPFTILQPCAYMQNLLGYLEDISTHGNYVVPYNIQARFSLVDLADVALAAARVLTESGHDGAIYELAGPEKLSSEDMALKLTVRLGGPVNAVQIPLQEWELSASSSGMPTGTVGSLAAMFRYYDKYGLIGNGNVLGWLLERSPTSLSQFLERTFAD